MNSTTPQDSGSAGQVEQPGTHSCCTGFAYYSRAMKQSAQAPVGCRAALPTAGHSSVRIASGAEPGICQNLLAAICAGAAFALLCPFWLTLCGPRLQRCLGLSRRKTGDVRQDDAQVLPAGARDFQVCRRGRHVGGTSVSLARTCATRSLRARRAWWRWQQLTMRC
eukprot:357598-Chlamydomonas_euryale.AAC.1